MNAHNESGAATIVGAGPSGLACAIVLSQSGAMVTVREARANVGARFHGDFQGLENWSSGQDVIEELTSFGIKANFEHVFVRVARSSTWILRSPRMSELWRKSTIRAMEPCTRDCNQRQ
ncbi:MAG: NAD(P)-binding protein [Candidatus Tyrphobacter sp.]